MKNLIKVLLATLMLVGFSTTSFAWVDCDGLEGYKSGSLDFKHDRAECTRFQHLYGNTDRDWVSKKTGIIRYANQEWNGINEYADGWENSSPEAQAEKEHHLYMAKVDGYYDIIKQYGREDGLKKIAALGEYFGFEKEPHDIVIKHLSSVSNDEIDRYAEKFPMHPDFEKFVRSL